MRAAAGAGAPERAVAAEAGFARLTAGRSMVRARGLVQAAVAAAGARLQIPCSDCSPGRLLLSSAAAPAVAEPALVVVAEEAHAMVG